MPDESEVEVQATQLRMMAESFRVENESSPADALIGSYTDDHGLQSDDPEKRRWQLCSRPWYL